MFRRLASLIDLDIGRLDDWPPLVHLVLEVACERRGRRADDHDAEDYASGDHDLVDLVIFFGETTALGAKAAARAKFESVQPQMAYLDAIREVLPRDGFFVTELMGFGVNIVTGDYSRGASGLWIQNGELTHAVSEVTIAGNLSEMLMGIEAIGSDLEFRGSVAAPTIKLGEMTVGGR